MVNFSVFSSHGRDPILLFIGVNTWLVKCEPQEFSKTYLALLCCPDFKSLTRVKGCKKCDLRGGWGRLKCASLLVIKIWPLLYLFLFSWSYGFSNNIESNIKYYKLQWKCIQISPNYGPVCLFEKKKKKNNFLIVLRKLLGLSLEFSSE